VNRNIGTNSLSISTLQHGFRPLIHHNVGITTILRVTPIDDFKIRIHPQQLHNTGSLFGPSQHWCRLYSLFYNFETRVPSSATLQHRFVPVHCNIGADHTRSRSLVILQYGFSLLDSSHCRPFNIFATRVCSTRTLATSIQTTQTVYALVLQQLCNIGSFLQLPAYRIMDSLLVHCNIVADFRSTYDSKIRLCNTGPFFNLLQHWFIGLYNTAFISDSELRSIGLPYGSPQYYRFVLYRKIDARHLLSGHQRLSNTGLFL
jgi:hypothetical protein